MTYYIGLGFIVTGVFLSVRSAAALAGQVTTREFDSPALFIFQCMFAMSMAVLGFCLRHQDLFESKPTADLTSRPAPTPASGAAPPRTRRRGRNSSRG